MTDSTLSAATIKLIEAVHALVSAPRSGPVYLERAHATLECCEGALNAAMAAKAHAPAAAARSAFESSTRDIGPRIAELRAHGYGVRQIARIVGVNASTVSRRLRKC